MASTVNPFLLAADHPQELLKLLKENPALASSQDEHGYSLLHAAASYNHLDLLRELVNTYKVDVNLKDEDGDTALAAVETLDAARVLVEELHVDINIRGDEGKTAGERIAEEGEFTEVAVYLKVKELELGSGHAEAKTAPDAPALPALPEGMSVQMGTLMPEELGEIDNQEFRQRIEELAAREDFQSKEGQQRLRELVTEAVRGDITTQSKDARRRLE